MNVFINGTTVSLPENITYLSDLVQWKSIPTEGTAIAINGKLVKATNWPLTRLEELDNLLVISAAYGG